MKKFHAFFTIITLAIIVIISSSCQKENPVTVFGSNGDTVYYTAMIDTYAFEILPAYYPDVSQWSDSVKYYSDLDSGQFVYTDLMQKLVLDKNANKSIRYIGGMHDDKYIYDYLIVPKDTIDLMDDNRIYLPKDTVYNTILRPYSYAIFEITEGSNTFKDTVFYYRNFEIKTVHHDLYGENVDSFISFWKASFDENSPTVDFLHDFDKLPFTIDERQIYMFDIYPYWYYEANHNPNPSIILYIN